MSSTETEAVTIGRVEKILRLAHEGSKDELRKEFEDFQKEYRKTRQAMDQRINLVGKLAVRPLLSNGNPMGTYGHNLLRYLYDTEPDRSKWIPLVLRELVEKRRIASTAQFLEWLLDCPLQHKAR